MKKLISAIITTYNRELRVLKRAVESVLNQTYTNFELIIVNDCPKNVCLNNEILQYINSLSDERIKYIVHDKNLGACKARNTGLTFASGDYVAFLDDDDEWLNNKLEKQLSCISESDAGAVYCYYNNILENGEVQKVIPCNLSGDLSLKLLAGNCVGGTSMPLIRKSVFESVGLFDEDLLSSQDHDMWLRISLKYKFICCDDYLVNRYMQCESITNNIIKQKQGFMFFINKHKYLYEMYKNEYNFLLTQKAKVWISNGYFKDGCRLMNRAIRVRFFSLNNVFQPIKGLLVFIKLKTREGLYEYEKN